MDGLSRPKISVVIPAYNEASRIDITLPNIWKRLDEDFESFEIIVVDDGSSDSTSDIVKAFSDGHTRTKLIRYDRNRGKGYAVRTGMLAAKGEYILFSDADMSTPIEEVHRLTKALREGFDIAIGSRATHDSQIIEAQPLYRSLMGKTFNKIVRLLTVRGINDTQCGFKCFKHNVAKEIFRGCRIDGFAFDVEVLFAAEQKGYRVKEIGVVWKNSAMSKVHPVRHSMQMLKELLQIRFFGLLGRYERDGYLRTSIES